MSRAIAHTDLVEALLTNQHQLDQSLLYLAAEETWLTGFLEALNENAGIPMKNIHLQKT